jgi:predicted ATPase
MLTRLKVSGFKNLADVDIRFGPFTCVAGVNGVGKSNLFDAIIFLSALAERPLIDAALSVRDEGARTSDIRSLFRRVGDAYEPEMSFEAEMIVPPIGWDDLGQEAKASITFLRYTLKLAYRADEGNRPLGSLEIVEEKLVHINLGDAKSHLAFPHAPKWRESAVRGRRHGGDFISTEGERANRTIKLHQDGGSGRPRSLLAANLPRTVLSATNAAESPTALLARNEMRSWRLLQLEPSALRTPDPFTAPTHMTANGAHLAATLYHLAGSSNKQQPQTDAAHSTSQQVYARVANRLANLINDVGKVWVDRDERRELLTLYMTDRYGTSHAARALSDGTLRFLALAVLELDPEGQGLLCLEEPENGIHPERIPTMLRLLRDLAVDVDEPAGSDNPLRQVIINTHSPAVVGQVLDDDLVMAQLAEIVRDGKRSTAARFCWLPDTWRAQADPDERKIAARGELLAYLNPIAPMGAVVNHQANGNGQPHRRRRVVDRPDIQPLLWPSGVMEEMGSSAE